MCRLNVFLSKSPSAAPRNWRLFFKIRLKTPPITARSFEKNYFTDDGSFERAYKLSISGFSEWSEAFPRAKSILSYPTRMHMARKGA